MGYTYITKYEKEILNATKEFAQENHIPFSKMTEVMIINTIRTVREDCKNLYMAKHGDKIRLLRNLQNPTNP